MSHDVFVDLPPDMPQDMFTPEALLAEKCFGHNCSRHARGAAHRCPIGRCQRFEDAIIDHMAKAEGTQ